MPYDKTAHPPEVFHYTNVAGLLGIVTSQALHASNILFLNDRQELRYVDSFIKERLASRFLEVLEDARRQGVMKGNFDPKQVAVAGADRFIEVLHDVAHRLAPIFVISFCRAENEHAAGNGLLSQWRGYGAEGAVAICFDVKELQEVIEAERQSFQYLPGGLCDVIYGASDSEFKTLEADFETFAGAVPELVESQLKKLDVEYRFKGNRGSVDATQLPFVRTAPRLKHPGFSEENEYRAIFPVAKAKVEPPSAAPRENRKVPPGP